jgi:hypothetical protein
MQMQQVQRGVLEKRGLALEMRTGKWFAVIKPTLEKSVTPVGVAAYTFMHKRQVRKGWHCTPERADSGCAVI